ncbi:MAG TPA: hypothetical protein VFQ61_08945, partial [Polyangiaceae bacterium]|nr:hypothetical protein [Polyangiaceae bacterium]
MQPISPNAAITPSILNRQCCDGGRAPSMLHVCEARSAIQVSGSILVRRKYPSHETESPAPGPHVGK